MTVGDNYFPQKLVLRDNKPTFFCFLVSKIYSKNCFINCFFKQKNNITSLKFPPRASLCQQPLDISHDLLHLLDHHNSNLSSFFISNSNLSFKYILLLSSSQQNYWVGEGTIHYCSGATTHIRQGLGFSIIILCVFSLV